MRAKFLKENGGIGAGFSYNGSVGGSSSNPMYSYDIRSLNHTLEQHSDVPSNEEHIHLGLTISGKKFNDKKTTYFGKLTEIKKENNNIKYYVILDEKTSTLIKLDPSTVSIVKEAIFNNVEDIWDYKLNNKGNLHNSKNENKIVPESLDELNEMLK